MTQFPEASANLLRALLINSAAIPDESYSILSPLGPNAAMKICGNGVISAEAAVFSEDNRVVLYTEDELEIDHFSVFSIPIPRNFQSGGRRTISVTLAFDPPIRRTRADYMGTKMNFKLIRGCSEDLIFEHYRKRSSEEERFPEIASRYNCKLTPGSNLRERNTVQSAQVTFTRDTNQYGDEYFLVVRCQNGWAAEQEISQRYAVVVELRHEAEIQLHARLQTLLRV